MKTFYLPAFLILIITSTCTLGIKTYDTVSTDSLVIYNYACKPANSGLIIDNDGNATITNPASSISDIIASQYYSNSIALISPSLDTLIFAGNKATGFYDIGTYPYSNAPQEGYYDYELPNINHYYFIRTESGLFARMFIIDYSPDSILFNIEVSLDSTHFNDED